MIVQAIGGGRKKQDCLSVSDECLNTSWVNTYLSQNVWLNRQNWLFAFLLVVFQTVTQSHERVFVLEDTQILFTFIFYFLQRQSSIGKFEGLKLARAAKGAAKVHS